jgi:hypothetical protein
MRANLSGRRMALTSPRSAFMSDAHDTHHAPTDPNAAPMRQEVRSDFSRGQLLFAWTLGAVAVVGGAIFGVLLVNS